MRMPGTDVPTGTDGPTGFDIPGPTCTDRVLNGNETGVDCGGDCPGCPVGHDLRRSPPTARRRCARAGSAPGGNCTDGVMDGTETDVDCGGGCPACFTGQGLPRLHRLRQLRLLWRESARRRPAPTRSRTRARPTPTAAGRPARSAPTARSCAAATDCTGGRCDKGRCSSCRDLIKNGDEVDVDCGGALCAKCGDGKVCRAATDCLNARCEGGVCISCVDRMKNGGEADVDCGGTMPAPSAPTASSAPPRPTALSNRCTRRDLHLLHRRQDERRRDRHRLRRRDVLVRAPTASAASRPPTASAGSAPRNACVAANCTDTVLNGTESDVDCGGTDCARCADTKVCRVGTDCASGVCTAGRCAPPSCTDGVKNQGETDVDCGGSTTCPRCADYKTCGAPTDCLTNACTMGYCGTTGCVPFGVPATAGRLRRVPADGAGRRACPARTSGRPERAPPSRTTATLSVTLPFSFNFYGVARTSMLLSASGGLSFNTTNPSTTNYCLPTTSYPYPMILPFWEHLHPSTGGVYTQTFGTAPNRRFVIQWDSVVYSSGTTLHRRARRAEGGEGRHRHVLRQHHLRQRQLRLRASARRPASRAAPEPGSSTAATPPRCSTGCC